MKSSIYFIIEVIMYKVMANLIKSLERFYLFTIICLQITLRDTAIIIELKMKLILLENWRIMSSMHPRCIM